jgi:hypothetical protein
MQQLRPIPSLSSDRSRKPKPPDFQPSLTTTAALAHHDCAAHRRDGAVEISGLRRSHFRPDALAQDFRAAQQPLCGGIMRLV